MAPAPAEMPFDFDDSERYKRLSETKKNDKATIKECAEATEKMWSWFEEVIDGELETVWGTIQSTNKPRHEKVNELIKRVNGATYMQPHKDVVNQEMTRLQNFSPQGSTGVTVPSIDSIMKLEGYLTLEEDVRLKIQQHKEAVESDKDEHGRPRIQAAAAALDSDRITMLFDAMIQNFEVMEAYKTVQLASRNQMASYSELLIQLRDWCNQNRKSVAQATKGTSGVTASVMVVQQQNYNQNQNQNQFEAYSSSNSNSGHGHSNGGGGYGGSGGGVCGQSSGGYGSRDGGYGGSSGGGGGGGGGGYGQSGSRNGGGGSTRRVMMSEEELAAKRKSMPCYDGNTCVRVGCPYNHSNAGVSKQADGNDNNNGKRSRSPSSGDRDNRGSGGTPLGSNGSRYNSGRSGND